MRVIEAMLGGLAVAIAAVIIALAVGTNIALLGSVGFIGGFFYFASTGKTTQRYGGKTRRRRRRH